MSEERRAAERHLSCIPAYIIGPAAEKALALIRDVSVTGARILTRAELDEGALVTLELYLSADSSEALIASGVALRVQPNPDNDQWRWQVGVRFEPSIDQHSKLIEEFTQRQREAKLL